MESVRRPTKVQMPSDPALHPAHIVAIRPDVDGSLARRGDYILSIETPQGARNVVAPADGWVEVHVSLMQALQPNDILFSIWNEDSEAAYSGNNQPQAETKARKKTKKTASSGSNKGSSLLSMFGSLILTLVLLALAVLAAGFVFSLVYGEPELTQEFAVIAAFAAFIVVCLAWVLTKLFRRRSIVASLALLFFTGALAAGAFLPSVRSFQKELATPVVTLAMEQLGPLLGEEASSALNLSSQPKTVVTLPAASYSGGYDQDPFIGDFLLVGFNFCPRGWTEANGQLLPIPSNSALFSLYGTLYGGDGRTTFGIPDMRGRAPAHINKEEGYNNGGQGQRRGTDQLDTKKGDEKMLIDQPYLVMRYCIALVGDYPSRN